MAIPALDGEGLLPPGIHTTTLDEIEATFATNLSRRALMSDLRRYLSEVSPWRIAEAILVDGSFVTSELEPNDIDLILLLRAEYDPRHEVPPAEYNLRSTRIVRRHFGLDLFAVKLGSARYDQILTVFTSIRGEPERSKGILRVEI